MKKGFQKILVLLLTLSMFMSMMAAPGFADADATDPTETTAETKEMQDDAPAVENLPIQEEQPEEQLTEDSTKEKNSEEQITPVVEESPIAAEQEVTPSGDNGVAIESNASDVTTADSQGSAVASGKVLRSAEAPAPEPVSAIDYAGDAVGFFKEDLTSGFGMFKIMTEPAPSYKLSADGKKVKLSFTPKNTTIYAGFYLNANIAIPTTWKEDGFIAAGQDGNYQIELDASYCGKAWPVAPVKKENRTETTSTQYYFAIPAADKLEKEEATNPPADPEKPDPATDKENEKPAGTQTPTTTQVLKDGTYKVLTTTDRKMFYIYPKEQDPAYSILKVANGKMTATITLTGSGYDYVFMGTPAEANKADKSKWIKGTIVNGYYTFTIPVSKLDTKLTITPHSKSYAEDGDPSTDPWRPGKWIIFYSGDAIKISDGATSTAENTKKPEKKDGATSGKQTSFKNDKKKDKESSWQDDSTRSTAAVNASTTLPDGVYTPDSFSWSGGSGRLAYIRCNKITVTNGQAYATIEFGSSSYDALRANGRVYSRSGGGNSTFVIPVRLNANNTIIGRTTAMSQVHWVEYSIYIGKAESAEDMAKVQEAKKDAAKARLKISEKAPAITGLKAVEDEDAGVEYAKYFKIYNYEGGVKLISIDISQDTALLEEYTKNSEKAIEDSEKEETVEYDDEGNVIVKTQHEYTEALYKNNVVNYLLVPEDFEVPAGLEKEYIIVTVPAEKTFMASPEAIDMMKDLNCLDAVSLLGMDEKDVKEESLKQAIKDDKVKTAGDLEKPDYQKVVKDKTELAILPDDLLPEEIKKDAKDKDKLTEEAKDMQKDLEKLESRFTTLDVPVIIDRSAQEKDELAQAEWIKVYGALYGCEEQADKIFDELVKKADKQ